MLGEGLHLFKANEGTTGLRFEAGAGGLQAVPPGRVEGQGSVSGGPSLPEMASSSTEEARRPHVTNRLPIPSRAKSTT